MPGKSYLSCCNNIKQLMNYLKKSFNKIKAKPFTGTLLLLFIMPVLVSWGTFGHERINHAAVLSLPPALRNFFYNHIDFVTLESTVPDLRKYTLNDNTEYSRHFADLENYQPLDSLPVTMEGLKKKYDEKYLLQNGILPWYLEEMMTKLTKAFKLKRKTEILFLAADMGHYIGDAHMPLHTSVNYDGQLTGQKGIHAFWEAQLPEIYGNGYTFNPAEARYIDNIHNEIWAMLNASHSLADTLLKADKKLRETYPADKILKKDSTGKPLKGKYNQAVHTGDYAQKYHTLLNGMVEKQMAKAITTTSNFWYTAWVNAGKPNLDDLDPSGLTKQNEKQLKKELELWKKGKVTGVKSDDEF